MHIRDRITALERRVRPAGLAGRWYTLLRACADTRRRVDPMAAVPDDARLWELARQAAAGGGDPGAALAAALCRVASADTGATASEQGD